MSESSDSEDYTFQTDTASNETQEAIDTVVGSLLGTAAGLLIILITRDYGIVVSSTIISGLFGMYKLFRVQNWTSKYGYIRRSSDNIINTFMPSRTSKNIESPVLISKIECTDADTQKKWEEDFPKKDVLTMIQDENQTVTLKIRFKNGNIKVVKINA